MGILEDVVDDYVYDCIKNAIIKYVLSSLSLVATGFWGGVVAKIVGLLVDKIIIPAMMALKEEGLLFIRKEQLKKKLEKYLGSQTDEEFDRNFDDLIAGN